MIEPFQSDSSGRFMCLGQTNHLVAGMTTRQGGESDKPFDTFNMGLHVPDEKDIVVQHRHLLARDLGFPLENWVMGEQVHGTNVRVIDEGDVGKGAYSHSTALPGVDGLITNRSNVLLTAFYADCVPLFFFDPITSWIGIAHAGWKGTVNQMAAQMVRQLEIQGASLNNIQMTIGPSIGQSHYEVDQRVVDHVPIHLHGPVVIPSSNQKYKLDLKELNRLMGLEAGLEHRNISMTRYCTYEEENKFFSHRRDHGRTGRMLGYIGWKG